MIYLLFFLLFFGVMLTYFKVADHFNIIDRPNERSSHTEVTIRGGGVIYVCAALVGLLMYHDHWIWISGLLIIGTISFIDDRITLSGRIRILFHLTAVTLLFVFLGVFGAMVWWCIPMMYVIIIGIINAYNFMDGINGITGTYSIIVLLGLQFVNYKVYPFITPDLIWLPVIASLVFLFFNFRTRAKCFAGDVGSVSIAFWIVMLLSKLIISSGNYAYVLFLAVYGVDTILTIMHRLYLKQNIFAAHRLHFYQILANERKVSHLMISLAYGSLQLIIIIAVLYVKIDAIKLILMILIPLMAVYVFLKPVLMKKNLIHS